MTLGELVISSNLVINESGIFAEDSTGAETFSLFSSTGNAVFAGELSAASGSFAGDISAATGTFSGSVSVGGTILDTTNTLNSNTTTDDVGIRTDAETDTAVNEADKTDGTVGGWTLSADNITANSNKIQLQKEGLILVGGSTADINGDVTDAVLTIDGTATSTSPVLSHSKFKLNADGSAEFTGTVKIGTTSLDATNTLNSNTTASDVDLGNVTNESAEDTIARDKVSGDVGGWHITTDSIYSGTKSTFSNNDNGLFLGANGTIAIGPDNANHLQWDGSNLDINGTIGGEISNIAVGSIDISDRLTIDEDGIISNDGTNITFSLDSNTGNAFFKGHIEATSGTFSGALSAASGTFEGDLIAVNGTLGSLTITSGGYILLNGTNDITIDNSGISDTNGYFNLSTTGSSTIGG